MWRRQWRRRGRPATVHAAAGATDDRDASPTIDPYEHAARNVPPVIARPRGVHENSPDDERDTEPPISPRYCRRAGCVHNVIPHSRRRPATASSIAGHRLWTPAPTDSGPPTSAVQ